MSDPSLPLQGALVAALLADAGVSALVGTRVYDSVPGDASFPYVSLGEAQVLPDKAECIDGTEVFPQIDAWSRAIGFPEVKQIAAAIVTALDDQALTVAGFTVVIFEISDTRYVRDPDGITHHAVLTFHARIEAQ